jgi:hypothetical protein
MALNNQINFPVPTSFVAGAIAFSTATALAFTAAGSTGQFLESQGAGTPIWTTISGLLTTWSTVTAGTLAAAINNGYVLNHASTACVVTLPATAPLGAKISFRGLAGSGGWTLTGNTGQTIQFGNQSSSSGGTWSSSNAGDSCDVECIVANTTWALSNCVSAQLTST